MHLSLFEYPSYLQYWLNKVLWETYNESPSNILRIFFLAFYGHNLGWVNSHRVSKNSVLNIQRTLFKRSISKLLKEKLFSISLVCSIVHAKINFETFKWQFHLASLFVWKAKLYLNLVSNWTLNDQTLVLIGRATWSSLC